MDSPFESQFESTFARWQMRCRSVTPPFAGALLHCHGIDSSLDEQIEESADFYAFLFDQLGLRAPEVAKK